MKLRRFMSVLSLTTVLFFGMTGKVLADDMFCDSKGHGSNSGAPWVNTALGCVPVDTATNFMGWLLPNLFGIAGGISFLLMIAGFIQMATSGGDPKAVQAAQDRVTSAVTGLIVSILAVFLIRLITYNILQIPGITP